MKTIVGFCLERPITTLTMHILLILGGFLSLQQIPLSALPDRQRARISVRVPYPNASPLQVENDVIRPLEEALATLRTVRGMESEANEGEGRVDLRFDYGEDLNVAKVEIRERVARVMNELPVEDIEQPLHHVDGHVHAGMVHLRDHAVGSELQVPEVRREEVFRIILTIDGPDHASFFPIHAKPDVRQLGRAGVLVGDQKLR